MRNYRILARDLPVAAILDPLARKSHLWNANTLRTAHEQSPHREVDDIWVWFNALKSPEEVINDLDVEPYPAWNEIPEIRPFIYDLMRSVGGVRLGRVIISRLAPGKRIYRHADGGAPTTYYTRFQIMLQCFPGVMFSVGNEEMALKSGDAVWFDNRQEHEVFNASADDRVAIIVDIRT